MKNKNAPSIYRSPSGYHTITHDTGGLPDIAAALKVIKPKAVISQWGTTASINNNGGVLRELGVLEVKGFESKELEAAFGVRVRHDDASVPPASISMIG